MKINTFALSIQNITKIYPNHTKANDEISLDVGEGEIVGIVGPNGAGKTTLIRQILGLLKPTSGDIQIYGESIYTNAKLIYEIIGYVPQGSLYYPALTIRETVNHVIRLQGIEKKEITHRTDRVLTTLGIDQFADIQGYQLSGGLQKAALLAVALAKEPRILVLDEPTDMIDLVKRNQIWEVINKYTSESRSVLLSSHDMNEVKTLCDRIYFLVGGKIVLGGPTGEILWSRKTPVEVEFIPLAIDQKVYLDDKVEMFQNNAGIIKTVFDDFEQGVAFLNRLMESGGARYLKLEGPSFDKVVLQIVEKGTEPR